MNQVQDKFERPLTDLRISVIDACNFRCNYCMPADKKYRFMPENELLSFEEIEKLVRIGISLGVKKIRITGGEPLLRKNLVDLVAALSKLSGLEDLCLTTNGTKLEKHATELKAAGLHRITVSLDAIDPEDFALSSGVGADIAPVLRGIQAAQDAGFTDIKLNSVLRGNLKEDAIYPLVEYAFSHGHILRFIEFMDVGNLNHWQSEEVVTSAEVLALLMKKHELIPLEKQSKSEVANRFGLKSSQGEIGFISSIAEPFCHSCSRGRISADGKFYTCLFATEGIDIKSPLRSKIKDSQIRELLSSTWMGRRDKYSEERSTHLKQKRGDKVEMYKIGG